MCLVVFHAKFYRIFAQNDIKHNIIFITKRHTHSQLIIYTVRLSQENIHGQYYCPCNKGALRVIPAMQIL